MRKLQGVTALNDSIREDPRVYRVVLALDKRKKFQKKYTRIVSKIKSRSLENRSIDAISMHRA